MTTLKLKQAPVPKSGERRAPLRGTGAKRPRPTLAQAEAERAARRATAPPAPGICSVHVRAIREICSRSYSPEQIDAWASLLSPDSYTAVLETRIMVVATDGGTVVGFGQLDPDTGEVAE